MLESVAGVEGKTTAITVFIYLNNQDPVGRGGDGVLQRNYGDSVHITEVDSERRIAATCTVVCNLTQ